MISREAPLAELTRAAGLNVDVFETPLPLVIVYGGASSGKSLGVSQSLKAHSSPYALVDCTAIYSAKELYREALSQLRESSTDREVDDVMNVGDVGKAEVKSTYEIHDNDKFSSLNFLSFYKALDIFMKNRAKENKPTQRVLYLALDHVDKLLDRGMGTLITCACTLNDQIMNMNIFEEYPPWEVCIILITRGMSFDFDRLVMPFFPAYVHFPPYKPGQLADILVQQLGFGDANPSFRTWLVHVHGLLPPTPDGDWLDFRAAIVHLLPEFRKFFISPVQEENALKLKAQLERETKRRVQAFLKTRRRHLFGYHKLTNEVGDPSELISCTNLSRNCLLLVLAGYLASFNPQETDVRFLSSSGGQRRKKRAKRNAKGETNTTTVMTSNKKQKISQLLLGPRVFTLQRLLAIYLNLRIEAEADNSSFDDSLSSETREEVFTHLATLTRMQLFQRTTPPQLLDNIKFRCLADARFVQECAQFLSFPLEAYLNRST
ncbi:putative origin recognition complex, subunit 5, P-loop containing nucleoside triphosphate hydrolase [Plasmopara halstedii]